MEGAQCGWNTEKQVESNHSGAGMGSVSREHSEIPEVFKAKD